MGLSSNHVWNAWVQPNIAIGCNLCCIHIISITIACQLSLAAFKYKQYQCNLPWGLLACSIGKFPYYTQEAYSISLLHARSPQGNLLQVALILFVLHTMVNLFHPFLCSTLDIDIDVVCQYLQEPEMHDSVGRVQWV